MDDEFKKLVIRMNPPSHGSSLCISLVLVFLMSLASESCNGLSSFGFDIHQRFSDPVKGIMRIDELIEKGTYEPELRLAVGLSRLQGPAREKEKRENERNELHDLVGKNLHVLSQIEGVDLDMYKDVVLPRVLEQVVNCKDELALFYLMDCIIQVFPDEYHLETLDVFLGAYPQLQSSVDIKTVMSQLMQRLSNYAASSAEVLPEFLQVEAFSKLSNVIGKVIEAQPDMPTFGVVTLFSSLLTFTLHVHPDRLDYADQGACVKRLSGKGKIEDNKATKQIVALLTAPLEKYNDVMTALKLSNYPRVVMASVIIQSIMKNGTNISTSDKVEALFELIKGLIKNSDGILSDEVSLLELLILDEDDFKEEQNSVACLIQMLYNDDPNDFFKIIDTVRKHILTGGPKRLPFTVPPLVFSSLKLARQMQGGQDENPFGDDESTTPKKLFQLLNQVEIPFNPARVLLQDFTGVPTVVDLAWEGMSELTLADRATIANMSPESLVRCNHGLVSYGSCHFTIFETDLQK
ncbi:hypothetical protein TanjilG_22928 [Lupinus angustifolius]|uniref:Uncharacterized protein n=1 Tax=Lupinus angustifolius TaxID=3871 RepID=A0A1J7I8J5_LUPAN|nr:hypothetical protein TanjilG_22928 [Lupinus angustifolius]